MTKQKLQKSFLLLLSFAVLLTLFSIYVGFGADVFITSLSTQKPEYVEGEYVKITAVIGANESVNNVTLNIVIKNATGNVVDSHTHKFSTIPGINFSYIYDLYKVAHGSGTYHVYANLSYSADTNPTNNQKTTAFNVLSSTNPKLEVSDAHIDVYQGSWSYSTITLNNTGNVDFYKVRFNCSDLVDGSGHVIPSSLLYFIPSETFVTAKHTRTIYVEVGDSANTIPPSQSVGIYSCTLHVSALGYSDLATSTITVNVLDQEFAPTIVTQSLPNMTSGQQYEAEINISDPDNDAHSFSLDYSVTPSWLSISKIDDNHARITGTVPFNIAGTNVSIKVKVVDTSNPSKYYDEKTYNVHVYGVPVINITSPSDGAVFNVTRNQSAHVQVIASAYDFEDGNLTSSILWYLNGVQQSAIGSPLSLNLNPGSYVIEARATDSDGHTTSTNISIQVNVIENSPPTITTTQIQNATVDQEYSITINANDPNGDTLRYELTSAPSGMSINATTGEIKWTPTSTGTYDFTVRVCDIYDACASKTYTINVREPVLDIISVKIKPTKDLGPGSNITIEVRIKNRDDEIDLDPVNLKVWLSDKEDYDENAILTDDDDDDIEDESEFSLDAGDDYKDLDKEDYTFTFELPYGWDDGQDFYVQVKAEGEDDNGNKYVMTYVSDRLSYEKERYALRIEDVSLNPSELSCNRITTLSFKIRNIGSKDIDDANLEIHNPNLGISLKEDVEEMSADIDDESNIITKSYTFTISDNVTAGNYPIFIGLSYHKDKEKTSMNVPLIIKECVRPTPTPTPTTPTPSPSPSPTQTPPAISIIPTIPGTEENVTAGVTVQEAEKKWYETTPALIGFIALIAIIIVIIVLLIVRRPRSRSKYPGAGGLEEMQGLGGLEEEGFEGLGGVGIEAY